MYLYFFDGRKGRIVKNIVEIRGSEKNNVYSADLYVDLENLENCDCCKYLYHGTMHRYDTFTNFHFENQNNKMERVFLYAINSFSHIGRTMGMFSGLSTQPMLPVAFKFMLSPNIVEEDEEMKELLRFSKEDIRSMKKLNMFVVKQQL